jgi:cytochrome P450
VETSALPPLPTRRRECPFDPPPEYVDLRRERPIARVRTPRGDAAWVVTRHRDIRTVLTDGRFSSDPRRPGYPSYLTGDIPPPPGFFLQLDAPDHPRLRRLVVDEFLASYVRSLRPRMQAVVDRVIDGMLEMAPPVDLVVTMALPVAAQVICELLGVRWEDYTFFVSRTDAVFDRSLPAAESEAAAGELMAYFDRLVTAKEERPGDDLLGRLVADPGRSGQISHEELVGVAALLLLAGYDTMAQVIGLGTLALLTHEEQLAALRADPTLVSRTVDEMLRYLTINHAGLPRVALEDVEVGGQLIRAGEGVLVMLNSGNRDETVFEDPDRFDVRRDARQHVAFGHGLHKCIGATFARTELRIVFLTLLRRVPTLRLAAPVDELPFRWDLVLYGVRQLPVAW